MAIAGGITALPNLRRNLTYIWALLGIENWSRYLVWYPVHTIRSALDFGAYAAVCAAMWWVMSWLIFFMIDITATWRRRTALPLAGATVLFCTLMSIVIRSYVLIAISGYPYHPLRDEIERLLRGDFYLTLMWVMAVAALGRGLQWWHVEKTTAVRQARLEAEHAHAELSAVAAQLEPHFLFNTLSAISTLSARDPRAAREMLEGLEDLMLYTTRSGDTVTLAEEMRFAALYLKLQSVRFAERLDVAIEIDRRSLDCVVPRLILQPVLENAIRHGIEQLENGGSIGIHGRVERGRLLLLVRNSDAGSEGRSSAGHGIGLACVQARLGLLFGDHHTFAIDHDAATSNVTVRMSMPELRRAS